MGRMITLKSTAGTGSTPQSESPKKPTVRDSRLDAIRGLLLVAMTIVHLPGALGHFVFQSLGYFAEAEGFVFLFGFLPVTKLTGMLGNLSWSKTRPGRF